MTVCMVCIPQLTVMLLRPCCCSLLSMLYHVGIAAVRSIASGRQACVSICVDAHHHGRLCQCMGGHCLGHASHRSTLPYRGPDVQVELNTISSSFGCLCTLVGQLHRYIMEHQGASQQVMHTCITHAFPHNSPAQISKAYIACSAACHPIICIQQQAMPAAVVSTNLLGSAVMQHQRHATIV